MPNFQIKFGGKPCIIPRSLKLECDRIGRDTESWWTKANSFRWTSGSTPGRGYVLLPRSSVDELIEGSPTLSELYALEFITDDVVVKMPSLIVVKATCVTPGWPADQSESVYLVEISDIRRIARMAAVATQCNVITPYFTVVSVDTSPNPAIEADPTYTEHGILNYNATPRTWEEFISKLWDSVAGGILGAYPGLPEVPPFYPYDLRFPGYMPALDVLESVLNRIGCTLHYDPFLHTFSIARVGDEVKDAALTDFLNNLDGSNPALVRDEPIENTTAKIPEVIRVAFYGRKYSTCRTPSALTLQDAWPFVAGYVRDVTPDTGEPRWPGTHVVLWEDFPLIFGTEDEVLNLDEADTVAEWRAATWIRAATIGGKQLHRVYLGAIYIPESSGVLVGAAVYDIGDGLKTEIIRKPFGLRGLEQWDHDRDWSLTSELVYPHENYMPPDTARKHTPEPRLAIAQLLTDVPSNGCGLGLILRPVMTLTEGSSQNCQTLIGPVSVSWTGCMQQELFNPTPSSLTVTGDLDQDKVTVLYDFYLGMWLIVAAPLVPMWVKLLARCERAYSGIQVFPQGVHWPFTKWFQCTNPGIFVEGTKRFELNIFDVNGCAFNVQGGNDPLIVMVWPGNRVPAYALDAVRTSMPCVKNTDPTKPQELIPYYLMDLGGTSECDSERLDLYS